MNAVVCHLLFPGAHFVSYHLFSVSCALANVCWPWPMDLLTVHLRPFLKFLITCRILASNISSYPLRLHMLTPVHVAMRLTCSLLNQLIASPGSRPSAVRTSCA